MRPEVSQSMVGYLTAYILAYRSQHRLARRVWFQTLNKFEGIVRYHWGW